ncbi:MAG: methyltransferase domain-containing protein [Ginsengibacter sp.]|jgi:2-polyprenyl-3-methyl-5-hydroxy-6-metoxy-1,4-benzoquinol methylase
MSKFSHRSKEKELLDGDHIDFQDISRNLKELDFINTHLGGHAITLSGFKNLLGNRTKISVCEIGCGGGDNLNALEKFCRKKGIEVEFIGIDINPECIEYARSNIINTNTRFILSDYKEVLFDKKPDILFSSLFCHHFSDAELIEMLQWMKIHSTIGFFINDLQRHPLAYHSIRLLTRLFSRSYLVKNDAPLSVLRAFKKMEWEKLLEKAQISRYEINWKWAFRYLIISKND